MYAERPTTPRQFFNNKLRDRADRGYERPQYVPFGRTIRLYLYLSVFLVRRRTCRPISGEHAINRANKSDCSMKRGAVKEFPRRFPPLTVTRPGVNDTRAGEIKIRMHDEEVELNFTDFRWLVACGSG